MHNLSAKGKDYLQKSEKRKKKKGKKWTRKQKLIRWANKSEMQKKDIKKGW